MLIAYLFIIPLLLSIASPLGFRLMGNHWPKLVSIFVLLLVCIIISLLHSAYIGIPQTLQIEWIPLLGLNINIFADSFGLLMALIITGIGSGIFLYSAGYLNTDPRTGTIIGWLLLFMTSMLGVVLADNILLFFVSWELTSLTSYILIGTNHQNGNTRTSARAALLVTAAGGLALFAALVLIGFATNIWNFSELPEMHNDPWATTIFLLICVAAFTKSAQWPFSFWLPAAMSAPTPISAYLHSATMVKAGIFLLARMHPVFSNHFAWTPTLISVSVLTIVMAIIAIPKATDLKALLAYSTIGALALMVCMLGIGTAYAMNTMVVFLIAHAFYKGPLFMVAGSIDNAVNSRDINSLGGLARKMPFTTLTACVAGISMIGFPPLLSFVAKEMILETGMNYAPWLMGVFSVLIVAFIFVACCVVITPAVGRKRLRTKKAVESPFSMLIPMLTISILGLVAGIALSPLEKYLVTPAVLAIGTVPENLVLWHGFTSQLALSGCLIILGIVAYYQRHFIHRIVPTFPSGIVIHDGIWNSIIFFAKSLTRLIQNGSLTLYLGTIIIVSCSFIIYAWMQVNAPINPSIAQNVTLAELSAGLLIMAGSLATALARRRLPAIAGLGAVGMGMTLFFIASQAPDLALTQFLVEIFSIVLLVVTFRHLPDFTAQPVSVQSGRLIIAVLTGITMTVLTLVALSTNYGQRVSQWYGLNSLKEGHGNNVVNVILVDFRALDTLGEITVLGIAALGVAVLMAPIKQSLTKNMPL